MPLIRADDLEPVLNEDGSVTFWMRDAETMKVIECKVEADALKERQRQKELKQ